MRSMRYFRWGCFVIALGGLFSGCSPNSLEDFHCEGEARCRVLVKELQKIRSREQLASSAPMLKKHFEDLVLLMIQAREYQETHCEEDSAALVSENEVSTVLEEELRRIYAIEGGREVIERAQQEALVRLDAFERSWLRKKQTIR